jgi:hypothetical protein
MGLFPPNAAPQLARTWSSVLQRCALAASDDAATSAAARISFLEIGTSGLERGNAAR